MDTNCDMVRRESTFVHTLHPAKHLAYAQKISKTTRD